MNFWTRSLLAPLLAGAAALTLAMAGCSSPPGQNQDASLKIVVAFYPFQFIAERVAGTHATVESLTQPGVDPHGLELTPKQVAGLSDADLVIYQQGFQPSIDEAITQAAPKNVIDTASFLKLHPADHDHADEHADDQHEGALDPHTWLDPKNMVAIAEKVRDTLIIMAPAAANDLRSSGDTLIAELNTLDTDFSTGLKKCERRQFITSHTAFGYLAERYNLEQIGIAGLEPDVEPTAARVKEIQALAREHHLTTVFYETLTSPTVAKAIAGDLGLRTDVLDPVGGLTPESRGKDYLEVMQANLKALRTANSCQ